MYTGVLGVKWSTGGGNVFRTSCPYGDVSVA
jgi:hypothetical protein